MRIVAHISDVHFGRENPAVVRALVDSVTAAKPHVVAISGDLTQRARVSQFKQAQEFLRGLPPTRIVVPGNHDISATNWIERLTRPLSRYRRYITDDLTPYYLDDEIAIVGVNTVRVLIGKNGRINQMQVADARKKFNELDAKLIRVVVTHHPLDVIETDPASLLVGRAAMAMTAFAECRVDLFLSGHLHTGHTIPTSARYTIPGYSAIVAQAGTAVSTRTRGEVNSWNLIRQEQNTISVQRMMWNPDISGFDPAAFEVFKRTSAGWTLQAETLASQSPQWQREH
jgi:3',5'-cyclic AMP phosphodiesterase CpdA